MWPLLFEMRGFLRCQPSLASGTSAVLVGFCLTLAGAGGLGLVRGASLWPQLSEMRGFSRC